MERHIPNLLTLTNLFCGFFGILACFNGDVALGGLMVFWGAFFDLLDGLSARLLKVSSPIGKELDSLADVVTFGLLPSVIVYFLLLKTHASWLYYIYLAGIPVLALTPFLITASAALRLAKFNIDTTQSKSFRGLPSPANGIFFASLPLILENDMFIFDYNVIYITDLVLNPYLLGGLIFLFAWLMVSPLPLFSFKLESLGWHKSKLIYSFALISVILFILLLWAAIPLIIFLYVILSYFNRSKYTTNEI